MGFFGYHNSQFIAATMLTNVGWDFQGASREQSREVGQCPTGSKQTACIVGKIKFIG